MREALVGSTSQIAALGRNVNQIARSLNGASSVVSKQNLETLAARIRGTIAERWPAAKGQGSAAAPAQIPPTS
jgi:hypothetical protein